MPSHRFWTLVLSIAITLSFPPLSDGQTTYGSVTGLVSDSSGAAVVGATVTLTNVGTSHKTTQPSGADGRFQFVNLVPGTYQIDVEKQGFKHFTRTDVIVQVNQSTTVDASMPSARSAKRWKSPAQLHCSRRTHPRWARWSRSATLTNSP